jgi:hypothetical protein
LRDPFERAVSTCSMPSICAADGQKPAVEVTLGRYSGPT